MTTHVLILCTHNSARSVLSEAMLNHWARQLGRDVRAHSAGSSPVSAPNAGIRAPISAWLICAERDSMVMTTEMPTDEPILRTRLK